jgi:hypothetical protein
MLMLSSILYPFLQYAKSILFSVLAYIQQYLHACLTNLFPHFFFFSNPFLIFS